MVGGRKVRMAIASKGKGKSGGARVITYNLYQEEDVIVIDLLTIYHKMKSQISLTTLSRICSMSEKTYK